MSVEEIIQSISAILNGRGLDDEVIVYYDPECPEDKWWAGASNPSPTKLLGESLPLYNHNGKTLAEALIGLKAKVEVDKPCSG